MLTRARHLSFPDPASVGAPWRRLGITGRPLGIAWASSIKPGLDDRAATARTRAATRDPAKMPAVQSASLERARLHPTARSAVTADQNGVLTADLMRSPAPHPTRAH